MARLKIDLLPKEAAAIKKSNQLVAGMTRAARIIAVLFVVTVAGTFGFLFFSNYQLRQVTDEVAGVQQQIEQSGEQEVRFRLYQEILSRAAQVIEQRRDYRGIFADLNSLVPAGVVVAGVEFGETEVKFTGEARGVQLFGQALESFLKVGEGEVARFDRVTLTSVSRGLDGTYKFIMGLGLKKT